MSDSLNFKVLSDKAAKVVRALKKTGATNSQIKYIILPAIEREIENEFTEADSPKAEYTPGINFVKERE